MKRLIIALLFLFSAALLFSQETDLLRMINDYRLESGSGILTVENKLNETAALYALELTEEGEIHHTDNNGRRVLDRYRDLGGTAAVAGEILGTSTETLKIFEAWKNSESHNEMMLNSKWLRIGLAEAHHSDNIVAVVLFSTSAIEDVRYSDRGDQLSVNIQLISSEDIELTHSGELLFFKDELPRLYPLFCRIKGLKKITDFLYIPDILLPETH